MKFCHLIESNMRNIFFEKSSIKCGGETSPRPFSKKSKLSISLDQQSEIFYSLFLLYVQASQGLPKYMENKVLTFCFYHI